MNGGMPAVVADDRECMLGEPLLPRLGESDSLSLSSSCFGLLSLKDNVSFLDPSLLLLLLLLE